jgi:hypothetical protein
VGGARDQGRRYRDHPTKVGARPVGRHCCGIGPRSGPVAALFFAALDGLGRRRAAHPGHAGLDVPVAHRAGSPRRPVVVLAVVGTEGTARPHGLPTETTSGNVKADVLEHLVPGFERRDFVEVIKRSAWSE